MGIGLKDFVKPVLKEVSEADLSGKIIGVDTYNYTYAYIRSITTKDGLLLEHEGHVTSHLSGFFFKIVDLLEAGVIPFFVVEGSMNKMKSGTIQQRNIAKKKIVADAAIAKEEGDIVTYNTMMTSARKVEPQMIEDLKEMLSVFGIPVVIGRTDAEAQIAYMQSVDKSIYATASQDYDSLLFGSKRFLRNLFLKKQREMYGKTIILKNELVVLKDVLAYYEITSEDLINIAIMCGTDYNTGIERVGVKTAFKLVKKYGSIENIAKNDENVSKFLETTDIDSVRNIFMCPDANENYQLEFKKPDLDGITDLMVDKFGFKKERITKKLENLEQKATQKSLMDFF